MKSFIEWIDWQIAENMKCIDEEKASKAPCDETILKSYYTRRAFLMVRDFLEYHHKELFEPEDEMKAAMDKVKAKYGLALDNLKDR